MARSLKDDGTVGSTKSDRFRRVDIGPELAAALADHAVRRMEQTASADHRALLFVAPVRSGKRDKGRWSSKGELGPIDRGTVSGGWHKEALQDTGLRDSRCTPSSHRVGGLVVDGTSADVRAAPARARADHDD